MRDIIAGLNQRGIYIRTANDAIRFDYGLTKSLQELSKIARGSAPPPSPKVQKMIEDAKSDAKQKAEKLLKKLQKKSDKYIQVQLTKRVGGMGFSPVTQGPIHKGKVSFKLTKNYFGMMGEYVTVKEMYALASKAHKEKKPFAEFFKKAIAVIEELTEISVAIYEGKMTSSATKKALSTKQEKILELIGLALGTGVLSIMTIVVVGGILIGASFFSLVSMILGGSLISWLIGSITRHGFKGTVDRIRSTFTKKTAYLQPSLTKQASLLKTCSIYA
jgi:hypothetical protein